MIRSFVSRGPVASSMAGAPEPGARAMSPNEIGITSLARGTAAMSLLKSIEKPPKPVSGWASGSACGWESGSAAGVEPLVVRSFTPSILAPCEYSPGVFCAVLQGPQRLEDLPTDQVDPTGLV